MSILCTITDHAMDRMIARIGCQEHTAQILAERAILYGQDKEETQGELRQFLDNISRPPDPPSLKIMPPFVYIFRKTRLVTIYAIPKRLL